jgi:galactofuranosylgalactofuranosylrhamnosyl-N-acetylglucosaminyl-diphospho-decaprenol beta-1,5/1,6-galactofuranosyltransferase
VPAASALPSPSEKVRKVNPPVGKPVIAYHLVRGVLHNLKKADPAHHQRPQLNVPTQDARWFLLCRFDGLTVTTADGRGVVYRQRDRAKMFSLLRKSLRRQRRLVRRFDEMRRVYRDALPVLSSKQKWESVLFPGRLAAPPARGGQRSDSGMIPSAGGNS